MHDVRRVVLARHIGISTTALANILQNRSEPTLRTARSAAAAFAISIDDLYADRRRCLAAAVAAFDSAPIRRSAQAGDEAELAAETPAAPTTPSSASGANDQVKSYSPEIVIPNPMQA